jgi:hypothetical protein
LFQISGCLFFAVVSKVLQPLENGRRDGRAGDGRGRGATLIGHKGRRNSLPQDGGTSGRPPASSSGEIPDGFPGKDAATLTGH